MVKRTSFNPQFQLHSDNVNAPNLRSQLWISFIRYTFFRLFLLTLITVLIIVAGLIIDVAVPLLVAILFALTIATPLGMIVGKKSKNTFLEAMNAINLGHKQERTQLRKQLQEKNNK